MRKPPPKHKSGAKKMPPAVSSPGPGMDQTAPPPAALLAALGAGSGDTGMGAGNGGPAGPTPGPMPPATARRMSKRKGAP